MNKLDMATATAKIAAVLQLFCFTFAFVVTFAGTFLWESIGSKS